MKYPGFPTLTLMMLAALSMAQTDLGPAGDLSREISITGISRQYGASAAEIRAEQHRTMYQVCNEHHDCNPEN